MGQKEFLTRLGFSENPFQFTNADEEEHLQSYFVPPPYFESVWGEPESPSSQVIFAPRGGGKSAQRRMIEYRASKENVFAITYDRFEKLSGGDLPSLNIGYHLRNIIELALLGFLLECNSRRLGAPSFSNSEKSIIESLCRHYLGRITRLEALDASKSLRTLSTKAKETLRDWSGVLSALVSGALTAHGAPHITQPSFAPATATPDMDAPAKIHLEVVLNLVKSIGFKSVYVLIDKVDETSDTSNNAEASFLLVKPLLRDLQLLHDMIFRVLEICRTTAKYVGVFCVRCKRFMVQSSYPSRASGNYWDTSCIPIPHARGEGGPRNGANAMSSLDDLSFYVLGPRVFGANMGCKIFIALILVLLHHFIERFPGGRSRRIKHPNAFGATPPLRTLSFGPYQFAPHGLHCTPRIWRGYALVNTAYQ